MKKIKILLFTLFVFPCMTLLGQTESPISLNSEGVFQIPTENLRSSYTIDVADLDFDSFEEAVDHFSQKNTDLVLFRPNASLNEATVFLQLSKKPQWSASEWNGAIASISLKNQ